jgi:hypothetical protein
MKHMCISEAATRIGMPAVGFSATALGAVSAKARANDPRNGAQGGGDAWSPPV